ncbi:tRNA (adenine(22)-N(1))-methyltransferase TrmK [Oleiphilus sp. HI0125]|uniref:tRNA (adenine(22)-N(1))-methyltransferase TrmK n=2 Tax=Oleiphilus sp. HI0125 TaxID=1822266 RepID=UPI0009EDD898|nr:tRNA (adenine(22)-N(1))-methyltransferase TrmK [Oleiphilus sp. HI0125]
MKIGKRLSAIKQHARLHHYDHIWDCCCDHGLLGMSIIDSSIQVHFVDIVPDIIESLQNTLEKHFPINDRSDRHWTTHCTDTKQLPLKNYADQRHLVVIAGVGGDLTTELVEQLIQANKGLSIDFLLCPVRHLLELRTRLAELEFKMVKESLVEENRRIYEVMLISQSGRHTSDYPAISHIGEQIWHYDSEEEKRIALRYANQTIKYYENKNKSAQADEPLKHFKQIKTRLCS